VLITKIQLAAMSRANLSEAALKRIPNTYLYVDEFQNFANESFAEILSESRKYKLALTVANQYIDQMTEEVRNAVIGNVGTFISFRVGSTDAEIMEKEFAPAFVAEDMVNLGIYQMYLKLMIDGIGSRPFSAGSLPPIPKPEKSYIEEIVGYSRKHYATEKEIVERDIKKWTNRDFNLEIQKAKENRERENREIKETREPKEVKDQNRDQSNREQNKERNQQPQQQPKQQSQKQTGNSSERNSEKEREKVVVKEIQRVIKEVEKKEESARRRAFLNLQRVHALQKNQSFAKTAKTQTEQPQQQTQTATQTASKKSTYPKSDLDEVPEDVLKALLDLGDL
jgi:hypothetical protein